MNKIRHHRTHSSARIEPRPGRVDETQASAARIAAEAAFAAPISSVVPISPAQVTVRRARVLMPDTPQAAQVFVPVDVSERKRSRVFRVETARVESPDQAQPVQPQSRDLATAVQARKRRARKGARAVEQRPGPVVLLHSPRAAGLLHASVAANPFESLAARLDRVTPILAAIERAQLYWFIDDGLESQWQRLARQADKLLKQVRARSG